MTPIHAVLFDLDGTLCEYRRSNDELLEIAFGRLGLKTPFSGEEYYDRFDELYHERGAIGDLGAFRERCFASLADDAGLDPEVGRDAARIYTRERDPGNVRPLSGAREALERTARRYPIGLITNGPPDSQDRKLAALGFRDAFETVVYAGYDTPAKPDPTPFHRALDAIDVTPERAVHVGDSLRADVAGAHAAGLSSTWVSNGSVDERPPGPIPDYVIRTPGDLLTPPWSTESDIRNGR
ncbi:HAD family hydrolase [Natronorarus salvus]|uniref:HAD family hydrolase n=1 Tax=Natronorarus salvus TaxID=3117733 RepID=UPI002F269E79